MSDTERMQLSEDVKAARKLLLWFGGSILAGIIAGVLVGTADHFALRELVARFDKFEQSTSPKVESMWYLGGWASDPRARAQQPSPARQALVP